MKLVSLKEYAKDAGVSYEAVRRQVAKHSDELKEHIIQKKGGARLLDEWAVDYLQEKRRESPIMMVNMDQSEEIETLKAQVEVLKSKLSKAQTALLEAQEERLRDKDQIIALQEESRLMIAEKAKMDAQTEQLEEAKDQIQTLEKERDNAIQEAQSYRPSWFGLYKKV